MDLKNKIFELAEGKLKDSSYFIIDITVSNSVKKVSIILDGDNGVNIDDCADLSRRLSEDLDLIMEDAYTLDVMSPGLDQPLKLKRQYKKNEGRKVKVKLKEGDVLKGLLLDTLDEGILVEDEKKKINKEIKFEEIDWTKVRVSFK